MSHKDIAFAPGSSRDSIEANSGQSHFMLENNIAYSEVPDMSLVQRKVVKKTGAATLCLLGGPFLIRDGERFDIPEGSKRLVVFVTLHGGLVSRRHAAGTLWPYGDDERAAGNLRSALWRLRKAGIDVLRADKCMLSLDPEVSVDHNELFRWAKWIIDGNADCFDLAPFDLGSEAMNLLPGWYDDWVIFEKERLRQRLLHAMELLTRRLVARGLFADAVQVAMTAVAAEPLRESAQRVLIEAHLAEGNLVEARRVYATYNDLMAVELGAKPSDELAKIIRVSSKDQAQRRKRPITRSHNGQANRATRNRGDNRPVGYRSSKSA
jgi:DNA-binding SARP family transcriptional activator